MSNGFDIKLVKDSLARLEEYIVKERYKGYDPFDILMSPLYKLPVLKSSKKIRFLSEQIFRRLPINLRPLLFVKKGLNPVTLGLCIQAYCNLIQLLPDKESIYKTEVDFCISALEKLSSSGYSGYCWGYDFDWEARYATMQAYTPTVVATGFITNALFKYYSLTNDEKTFKLLGSSVKFVIKDLNKSYEDESFCYSYSPIDHQKVLNATMKGARLLMQVYSLTNEESLHEEAEKTIEYVVKHQKQNGAWSYSVGDAREWVDNFHTGYILDCLDEYINLSGDNEYEKNLKLGVGYYVENFFTENGTPKYFDNSIYPIDSTAAAQSIITLLRFSYLEKAWQVAEWMIQNMQSNEGYFYFQKHKLYTNRINYMRWSNAWMFLTLSQLLYTIENNQQ
ncbi:MAG: delta-aminolevulinic acid dehydratase [Bacteroidetes bacterium]|nr:delta-aminolevulinic acid dehydratase [Bacteroidota bacterium]